MARIFGSLKSYLVDLWRRCFASEYLVKAEGASTAVHDFRKCADCGAHTKSLYPEGRSYCKSEICGAFLCMDGIYSDTKNRTFVLRRPLYGKLDLLIKVICFINFIAVVSVFRIRQVFIGYEADLIGYPLFSVFLLVFIIHSGYYMVMCMRGRIVWLNIIFCILIATYMVFSSLLVSFMAIRSVGNGYHIAPYWVKIPTQQEVYDSQLSALNAMPDSAVRFGYAAKVANNPQINMEDEFMRSVKADFAGMMKDYPTAHRRLKAGSTNEQMFYGLYLNYLLCLDQEARKKECETDPWSLVTGSTAARYPDVLKACEL